MSVDAHFADARQLAEHIISRLRAKGFDAYLAGGCVRDTLMGQPSKDYDVATSANPAEVQALFPRTVLVGAKFGVVVVLGDSCQVEVATFRSDGQYLDGRHPESVSFGDAAQDVYRRDFTINAMLMDSVTGDVIDLVGGRDDIERRLIRAVGDPEKRFREDALRLIRAVRFSSGLGFEIEADTWKAIRACAEGIDRISRERIRDELVRGLTGCDPGRFVELLSDSTLLDRVLPEVEALRGCPQPPEFHPEGDVFVHTVLVLKNLPGDPSAPLAMAALLHDVGKPPTMTVTDRIRFNDHATVGAQMAEEVCRRLAFSGAERDRIVDMVARHMDFMNLPKMRESTLRRFLSRETIEDDLLLHRADCLGSHGDLSTYDLARARLADFARRQESVLPEPILRGNDLIALGMVPGPQMGVVLRAVHDAQIEGRVDNRDAALQLARDLWNRPDTAGKADA